MGSVESVAEGRGATGGEAAVVSEEEERRRATATTRGASTHVRLGVQCDALRVRFLCNDVVLGRECAVAFRPEPFCARRRWSRVFAVVNSGRTRDRKGSEANDARGTRTGAHEPASEMSVGTAGSLAAMVADRDVEAQFRFRVSPPRRPRAGCTRMEDVRPSACNGGDGRKSRGGGADVGERPRGSHRGARGFGVRRLRLDRRRVVSSVRGDRGGRGPGLLFQVVEREPARPSFGESCSVSRLHPGPHGPVAPLATDRDEHPPRPTRGGAHFLAPSTPDNSKTSAARSSRGCGRWRRALVRALARPPAGPHRPRARPCRRVRPRAAHCRQNLRRGRLIGGKPGVAGRERRSQSPRRHRPSLGTDRPECFVHDSVSTTSALFPVPSASPIGSILVIRAAVALALILVLHVFLVLLALLVFFVFLAVGLLPIVLSVLDRRSGSTVTLERIDTRST